MLQTYIFLKGSCRKRHVVFRRVIKVSNKCVFKQDPKANVKKEDLPQPSKSCIFRQDEVSRLTFKKDSNYDDEFPFLGKRSAREEGMSKCILSINIKISINCSHKWVNGMIKMLFISFVILKQTKQRQNSIFLLINTTIKISTAFLAIILRRRMTPRGNTSKYGSIKYVLVFVFDL